MSYFIEGEPVPDACEECGRNDEYDRLSAIDESGETVGLCLMCAVDTDSIREENEETLEEIIEYELTEMGLDSRHPNERGWSVDGAFAELRVEFQVEDKDIMNRVAVDDYKRIGSYRRLTGSPTVYIEAPVSFGRIRITPDLDRAKERINEERKENAPKH